jgi:GH35 family endo-1,4-beta-xylanase
MAVSPVPAEALSEEQILQQADARIEKHRTADAVIKLLDKDGKPLAAGRPVRIEQTRHAFLFGSNIFTLARYKQEALNQAYARHFAELLNFATLPFYWWAYERQQGKPDYARTMEIIRWCNAHQVTCKGHPLAWNWMDPKWLPEDPDEVMKLQYRRIHECVARFKTNIRYWDVVNEATHYDRPGPKKDAAKLTAAIEKMGVPAYVQGAFKAARKADPEAVLIINDYRTDAEFIDKVITKLVDEDGKPLYDVIGIQSHQHGGAWSAKQAWDVCERFAKFGKPLHFTETTILSGRIGGPPEDPKTSWDSTPEGEKRQAQEVARFYTVLFSHPAVEAITWWDFSDLNAWQGAPAGFLRKDMTPKPAYDALKGLIKGKWWTKSQVKVGDGGQVQFHGFLGDYRVGIGKDGRELTGTFTLERAADGPVEVHVK